MSVDSWHENPRSDVEVPLPTLTSDIRPPKEALGRRTHGFERAPGHLTSSRWSTSPETMTSDRRARGRVWPARRAGLLVAAKARADVSGARRAHARARRVRLCRAIRGKSSDSRQQYLSQQYPSPLSAAPEPRGARRSARRRGGPTSGRRPWPRERRSDDFFSWADVAAMGHHGSDAEGPQIRHVPCTRLRQSSRDALCSRRCDTSSDTLTAHPLFEWHGTSWRIRSLPLSVRKAPCASRRRLSL